MKNFIRVMSAVLLIFTMEVLYIHHRLDSRLERLERHQAVQFLQVEEMNRSMFRQLGAMVQSREQNIETIRSARKSLSAPPLIMAAY